MNIIVKKYVHRAVLIPILLALIFAMQPMRAAHAAAFLVNTNDDTHDATAGDGTCADAGGNCSLRAAIEEANALAGADTIGFAADYVITLILGSELLITSDIDITGTGMTTTITQANALPNTATYRVLHNNGGTVNISNVTIRHGVCNVGCAVGGGIYNQAGIMTLTTVTVGNNVARGAGGGVSNAGTLNIEAGSIIGGPGTGNSVRGSGGGISNVVGATVTISNSTVSANTAGTGGGITNLGTLNIENGSVIGEPGAGNFSITDGGGVFNLYEDALATISDSTISANSTWAAGGGIANMEGTLSIYRSTIGGEGAGNSAVLGGGILLVGNYSDATVTDSRILYNTASEQGGGIYVGSFGTTSVTANCIVGNSDTAIYSGINPLHDFTGNWWGAPDGPGPLGPGSGDTISANIIFSDFLTAPLLDCPTFIRPPVPTPVPYEGAPNLVIDVSVGPKIVNSGGVVTWTVQVSNIGSADAHNVTARGPFPTSLVPDPSSITSPPGGTASVTGQDLLANFGTLSPSANKSMTIKTTAQFASSLTEGLAANLSGPLCFTGTLDGGGSDTDCVNTLPDQLPPTGGRPPIAIHWPVLVGFTVGLLGAAGYALKCRSVH